MSKPHGRVLALRWSPRLHCHTRPPQIQLSNFGPRQLTVLFCIMLMYATLVLPMIGATLITLWLLMIPNSSVGPVAPGIPPLITLAALAVMILTVTALTLVLLATTKLHRRFLTVADIHRGNCCISSRLFGLKRVQITVPLSETAWEVTTTYRDPTPLTVIKTPILVTLNLISGPLSYISLTLQWLAWGHRPAPNPAEETVTLLLTTPHTEHTAATSRDEEAITAFLAACDRLTTGL